MSHCQSSSSRLFQVLSHYRTSSSQPPAPTTTNAYSSMAEVRRAISRPDEVPEVQTPYVSYGGWSVADLATLPPVVSTVNLHFDDPPTIQELNQFMPPSVQLVTYGDCDLDWYPNYVHTIYLRNGEGQWFQASSSDSLPYLEVLPWNLATSRMHLEALPAALTIVSDELAPPEWVESAGYEQYDHRLYVYNPLPRAHL